MRVSEGDNKQLRGLEDLEPSLQLRRVKSVVEVGGTVAEGRRHRGRPQGRGGVLIRVRGEGEGEARALSLALALTLTLTLTLTCCWQARARASFGVTKSVKLTRSHSPS